MSDLRDKMKKARLENTYRTSFSAEQDKSLGDYKFNTGDKDNTPILETPIRRLLDDAVFLEANLAESFRALYFNYKELGLDLIEELIPEVVGYRVFDQEIDPSSAVEGNGYTTVIVNEKGMKHER